MALFSARAHSASPTRRRRRHCLGPPQPARIDHDSRRCDILTTGPRGSRAAGRSFWNRSTRGARRLGRVASSGLRGCCGVCMEMAVRAGGERGVTAAGPFYFFPVTCLPPQLPASQPASHRPPPLPGPACSSRATSPPPSRINNPFAAPRSACLPACLPPHSLI